MEIVIKNLVINLSFRHPVEESYNHLENLNITKTLLNPNLMLLHFRSVSQFTSYKRSEIFPIFGIRLRFFLTL